MTTTHTLVTALADVRERLQTKDSGLVAQVSGVHYTTITGIAKGRNLNPTICVLTRISEALDSMEGIEHD